MLIILAIILVVVVVLLFNVIVKKTVMRLAIIALAVFVFLGGGKLINLNTLPMNIEKKVYEVVDAVGDSYIKTNDDRVLIKIEDEWYDVADISVVGEVVNDEVTIRYEGKEIKIGQSGVVNTIKVLEKVGLLDNSKD